MAFVTVLTWKFEAEANQSGVAAYNAYIRDGMELITFSNTPFGRGKTGGNIRLHEISSPGFSAITRSQRSCITSAAPSKSNRMEGVHRKKASFTRNSIRWILKSRRI